MKPSPTFPYNSSPKLTLSSLILPKLLTRSGMRLCYTRLLYIVLTQNSVNGLKHSDCSKLVVVDSYSSSAFHKIDISIPQGSALVKTLFPLHEKTYFSSFWRHKGHFLNCTFPTIVLSRCKDQRFCFGQNTIPITWTTYFSRFWTH